MISPGGAGGGHTVEQTREPGHGDEAGGRASTTSSRCTPTATPCGSSSSSSSSSVPLPALPSVHLPETLPAPLASALATGPWHETQEPLSCPLLARCLTATYKEQSSEEKWDKRLNQLLEYMLHMGAQGGGRAPHGCAGGGVLHMGAQGGGMLHRGAHGGGGVLHMGVQGGGGAPHGCTRHLLGGALKSTKWKYFFRNAGLYY